MENISVIKILPILFVCFTAIGCDTFQHIKQKEQANIAFREINEGIDKYRRQFGVDPESYEDLDVQGYFKLRESVTDYWEFSLVGSNPVTEIRAEEKIGINSRKERRVMTFKPKTAKSNFGH